MIGMFYAAWLTTAREDVRPTGAPTSHESAWIRVYWCPFVVKNRVVVLRLCIAAPLR
jgi:hypothetical protein